MTDIFFNIIIFPIEQIIEIGYTLIYKVFDIPGIALIGVSLTVTLLSLPLYIIAEKLQEKERQTINRLKPKIDKIKQVFKGDEQYMILSTYYRQNGYHPVYALRNSLNILIQIPFFIAAYHFISHLDALQGVSFSFIADLGKPDRLLGIGGSSINVLPVIMTIINCTAGAVYTKELGFRDRVQVYGVALVFLVLLYNSPAGLVLYWTMNNIFSLIKNIFYRLNNPAKTLYYIMSACILLFVLYLLFINDGMLIKRLMLALICSLTLFIPLIIKLYIHFQNRFLTPLMDDDKKRLFLFLAACVVLAILIGFSIPSSTIASSPEEFSFIDTYRSPLPFVFTTLIKSVGMMIFWPLCVYFLFGKILQTLLAIVFLSGTVSALLNTFAFQGNYSAISNTFTFNNSLSGLNASIPGSVLSILCALLFLLVIVFLIKKNRLKIINTSLVLVVSSLTVFSIYNIVLIQKSYANFASLKDSGLSDISRIQPVFHLSRNEPNIIIIMADQAIGGFVRPIFDEQSDLYRQFEGFKWFPNTLSFSMHTLTGVPPVFGGYEYTPLEMNRRDSIPLVEKHNEALLVLPRILTESGYRVTVTDPPLANYASTSDTGIFEEYGNINAFNTIGRYTDLWYSLHEFDVVPSTSNKIIRNTFWFSVLRISPPFLRKAVYDDGKYWATDENIEPIKTFLDSYAVLDFLPELTAYDEEKPSAVFINNETTHHLVFLQYPSYTPVQMITDTDSDIFSGNRYFHINSAFFLKIGEWFDELKKNGVYDSSRIIIVSDHGHNMNAGIADTELPIPNERREAYNPLLLFKDFNSNGKLQIDMSFMTNADVPFLALDGIAATINPFTGKSLRENSKSEGVYITTNHLWQPHRHNKRTFNIDNDQWLFVKENIFDFKNWEIIKP